LDAAARRRAAPGDRLRPPTARRRRLGTALVHPHRRKQPVRPRYPGHRPRPTPRPRHPRHRPLRQPLRRPDRPHPPRRRHHPGLPRRTPTPAPAPDGLAEALGATPQATYRTGALGDLLAVLADEATIRAITPYLAALAHLTRRDGIRGVTASAHTALAPYWSHRLGRDRLTGLQASARTGLVHTAVRGDRVHLTGHAVTILDGALHHPAG